MRVLLETNRARTSHLALSARHTGDKHSEGMYAAAALLESYLRQIQSIEGNLREADENIDTVREVPWQRPAICRALALLHWLACLG